MAGADDVQLRILAEVADARRNIEFLRTAFLNAVNQMAAAAAQPDFDPVSEDALRLNATVLALGQQFSRAFNAADKEVLETGRALKAARGEVDHVDNALKKLNRTGAGLSGITGTLKQIRGGLLSIGASLGVAFGGRQIVDFIRTATQARVELQALRAQLDAAAGSTEAGGLAYDFARRKAVDLGFAINDVVQAQARFEAATRQSNLSLAERREIFESVINTGRVLQLSQQRVNNAFLALEQIASKGRVSMEELRRQLGDQIPGALPILAKQLGITTGELIKMVEAGELMADVALPALAKGLRETFGPGLQKAIETDAAAIGRLQVAAFEARAAFAEGFGDEFRGTINTLTEFINENRESWENLGESLGLIAQITGDVTTLFSPLKTVLEGLGVETATVHDGLELIAKAVNSITSPIERATEAANAQARALGILPQEARSVEESLDGMRPALELLAAKQREATEAAKVDAEVAAKRVLAIYGEQIPALKALAEAEAEQATSTAELIAKAKEGDAGAQAALDAIIAKGRERVKVLRETAKALTEEGIASGAAKTVQEQVAEALEKSAKAQAEFNVKLFETTGGIAKNRDELESATAQIITAIDGLERFGQANVEQVDKALDFALKVAQAYREMGDSVPEDLIERIDRLAESSVSGAEKVVKALREEAQGYAALGKAIPDDLVDRIERLEKVTNDHARAMALSVIGMKEYRKELLGSAEEADTAAAQIVKLVDGFGLLGPATAEQAEVIKEETQDILDSFAEIGVQPPLAFQRLADSMGVTTTRIEKEAAAQIKALDSLLKAFDRVKTAQRGETDAERQLASERAELEKLRKEQSERGVLDQEDLLRQQELEDSIASLEAEVEDLGLGWKKMGQEGTASIEGIDDAIQAFLDGSKDALSTLPPATQEAVVNILGGLQQAADQGQATEEVIRDSLLKIGDRMREAGVDTQEFESSLAAAGDGGVDLNAVLADLQGGIGDAATGMQDFGTAVQEAKTEQEKQAEAAEAGIETIERFGKVAGEVMDMYAGKWDVVIGKIVEANALCREHEACLAGS